MGDPEKTEKTSIGEAEPKKIWLIRKLEKLPTSQWILLFIVFVAAVFILDEILTHFGILAPREERCPERMYRYNDCENF